MTKAAPTMDTRLPVTLLSGFLGSGKTTLLSYILKSKDHGLRCAIIVNDMGALNIDASLIANHKLTQKEEKVVQMQNGCICCTLRADLLEEVANLAEAGTFDYLIIESTGISEPIQVAETFTQEFAQMVAGDGDIDAIKDSIPEDSNQTSESRAKLAKLIAEGGLSKVARLDCCASVVDCTTFLDDFETTDFLTDRHGEEVTPEDERNITDLLTDQIEFANVILLNKTDMMPTKQVDKIETLVKALNPSAKVLRTIYSRIDLKEILSTNLFDFEQATLGAGWLQSLKELMPHTDAKGTTRMIPKPETLEYGISSFVYTARRPFHPKRLWELLSAPFAVIQTTFEDEDEEDEENSETEDSGAGTDAMSVSDKLEPRKGSPEEEAQAKADTLARLRAEKEELDLPARQKFKKESAVWKGVLRSKGFCWLATRNEVHGEWSQAGVMFTLSGGSNWMAAIPESQWPSPEVPEVRAAIKADLFGEWGDRRQELVFIGQDLNQEGIEKVLNDTCLTDSEWNQWERVMKSRKSEDKKVEKLHELFEDGWEDWIDPSSEMDEEEDVEHAGHGHEHGHPHKKAKLSA